MYIGDPGYIVSFHARIFNNQAGSGGAVYQVASGIDGYSRLSNTYVSTNTAQGAGGAIFVGPGGKLQLTQLDRQQRRRGSTGRGYP